jgi:hypothetical protein
MKNREKLVQHLAIAFILALVLYWSAFSIIEHLRIRKGGWQVTFKTDDKAVPSISVSQPALGLADIRLVFPHDRGGQTNLASTIVFDQPITNVPFGKVIYLDTTFLPGAIVFGLFGHQIQLVPRVLVLDGKEVPWQNGTEFRLQDRGSVP